MQLPRPPRETHALLMMVMLGIALERSPAAAQSAAPPDTQPAVQTVAPPEADRPAAGYSYQPSGRRDPFLSLIAVGEVPVANAARADGAAGIAVGELVVRGVMKANGMLIALVQGTDKRTFVVHQGDRLHDGTITAVVPEGLVIMQSINDPLSSAKQREVRKRLRPVEDGQQ